MPSVNMCGVEIVGSKCGNLGDNAPSYNDAWRSQLRRLPSLDGDLELQRISINMADESGYAIVRNSIPVQLADEAAAAIHFGLQPRHSHGKHFEYPVPPIGTMVYEEFMKVTHRLYPLRRFHSDLTRTEGRRFKNSLRRLLCPQSRYPSTSVSFAGLNPRTRCPKSDPTNISL